MMRTTLVHILLFLGPSIAFFLYLVATRKVQMGVGPTAEALRGMPWPWLLGGGLILMAASLVALALTGGGEPGGTYVAPHVVEGEVVPGEVK